MWGTDPAPCQVAAECGLCAPPTSFQDARPAHRLPRWRFAASIASRLGPATQVQLRRAEAGTLRDHQRFTPEGALEEESQDEAPGGPAPTGWTSWSHPQGATAGRRERVPPRSAGPAADRLRRAAGRGPSLAGPGNPAWRRRQRQHGLVNFANWPDYIDRCTRPPDVQRFQQQTGITVNYTEPVSENMPFYNSYPAAARPRQVQRLRRDRHDDEQPGAGRPDVEGLPDPARPVDDDQLPRVREPAGGLNPPGPGKVHTMAGSPAGPRGYNARVDRDPGDGAALRREVQGRLARRATRASRDIRVLRNGILATEAKRRGEDADAQRDDGGVRGHDETIEDLRRPGLLR